MSQKPAHSDGPDEKMIFQGTTKTSTDRRCARPGTLGWDDYTRLIHLARIIFGSQVGNKEDKSTDKHQEAKERKRLPILNTAAFNTA